ncbi:hypothetical protein [Sphingomonas sp. OV641]|uniref:hypothetical protein n=1 Tax=Sphingomonas sp. OV641 TaxID=1881068 RepID=UPI000B878F04|nr:hypothetical protein [Sphingomonas sp. OV641]
MKSSGASDRSAMGAGLFVIVTALLQIATPALPALGIGEQIGAQSDRAQTLVTPAGWAFSIWGALYTGSLVFAVYQMLPSQRHNRLLHRLRRPAAFAFLGNAAWAAYVQTNGLSFVSSAIIVFTLVNLLIILRRLSDWPARFTPGERWCAMLPLSALAAWLSAATIVNVAASLRFLGVEAGESAPVIAAAVIVFGGLIASGALLRTAGNPPYGLVFLWALAAIFAAGGQEASPVALAVVVAALLILGALVLGLRRGGAVHWLGAP